MRISKTLKYILSSLLFLTVYSANGQTVEIESEKPVKNKVVEGLSIGVNVAPLIIIPFEPGRIGFGFVGRYIFKQDWSVVGETGFENVDVEKDTYRYKSNGGTLKLGVDYNFFHVDEPGNNDNITIGLRYGFATQNQESPYYKVIDDYWGDYIGSFGKSNVTSNWMEMVFGMRTEVFKNFFMGWSVRMKILIDSHTDNALEPYTIPGYGKWDNKVNLGFSYTFEYQIPFKKN
ncbi:MAG: hypothetical protein GXO47_08340 [Chlorobi bacterium]|nr:hypothetical protein [Chlorobiota bacterium]